MIILKVITNSKEVVGGLHYEFLIFHRSFVFRLEKERHLGFTHLWVKIIQTGIKSVECCESRFTTWTCLVKCIWLFLISKCAGNRLLSFKKLHIFFFAKSLSYFSINLPFFLFIRFITNKNIKLMFWYFFVQIKFFYFFKPFL